MCAVLVVSLWAQRELIVKQPKKKDKELPTQTLETPKDLPNSVIGETRHLEFYVTPLTAKGLLSQQVREALRALSRQTGAPVLHLRAFTAGTGDLRRVRDLVSEYYTERRQPPPALTLVQTGGLPLEGAQVVLEATVAEKKDLNPHGLAFVSPAVETAHDPLDPVAPLAERSLAALRRSLEHAEIPRASVQRVTCFLTSLENLDATRRQVSAAYPQAAANFIQTQRAPSQAMAACEAVASLSADPPAPASFSAAEARDPAAMAPMVSVGAPRVLLTGSQIAFGYREQDGRLVFDRLHKELEQAGCLPKDVVLTRFYSLSGGMSALAAKLRGEFFAGRANPAGSMLLFEGLPALEAGFAADLVAVKP